ncbi:hypothetical protein M8C21_011574, partial [Ambrosia artemisiifolia]
MSNLVSYLISQAHIVNYAYSFVRSISLKCAIKMQIPDIINCHGAPMLLSKLVDALPINKERFQYIYRLMRILVHAGFFEDPLNITPLFLVALDPIMLDPWQNMSKWLCNENDINLFQTTHGKMAYELETEYPNLYQSINEGMASDRKLVASVILKHCKGIFDGLDPVVDVGGGTGTFAKCTNAPQSSKPAFITTSTRTSSSTSFTFTIASSMTSSSSTTFTILFTIINEFSFLKPQTFKLSFQCCNSSRSYAIYTQVRVTRHLQHHILGYTIFDLPQVVKGLEGSKNLSFVGGDMFETIPNAHAVLFKVIPTKESGGKVIIIEMVLKDEESGNKTLETQLFNDMFELILAKGRQRSEKDWAK